MHVKLDSHLKKEEAVGNGIQGITVSASQNSQVIARAKNNFVRECMRHGAVPHQIKDFMDLIDWTVED